MGKRIYVGNLSFAFTEELLRQTFAPYGELTDAQIVVDRDSGQSRGFGFVTMSTDESAAKAIEALHGTSVDGRALNVSPAVERQTGARRGFGGFGGPGSNRGGR